MPKDTRSPKLEAAFAEPDSGETKVGSLRLRPFSLGTLNVAIHGVAKARAAGAGLDTLSSVMVNVLLRVARARSLHG